MTIIEQIKAEIERRTKELEKDKYINLDAKVCRTSELRYISRFLDTPESEKPAQEGLGEEIGSYMSNKWKFGCITPITPVVLPNFTTEDLKECARHFAQWGAEHLADARKTSPKDLADAAKFSSRLDGFFYGKGYEQAEKDLGWISVKDKLPGPSEWVLACIEQHGHAQCLTLAVYSEETKEWHTDQWEDGEEETVYVEYWMPIPNIIKEEKK